MSREAKNATIAFCSLMLFLLVEGGFFVAGFTGLIDTETAVAWAARLVLVPVAAAIIYAAYRLIDEVYLTLKIHHEDTTSR